MLGLVGDQFFLVENLLFQRTPDRCFFLVQKCGCLVGSQTGCEFGNLCQESVAFIGQHRDFFQVRSQWAPVSQFACKFVGIRVISVGTIQIFVSLLVNRVENDIAYRLAHLQALGIHFRIRGQQGLFVVYIPRKRPVSAVDAIACDDERRTEKADDHQARDGQKRFDREFVHQQSP